MSITDLMITALVGILVVFTILVLLMASIKIISFVVSKVEGKAKAGAAVSDTTSTAPTAELETAPGSCGDLMLKDVSDREAAMIMAIVADKLETPLNELKFISIKKAEENK